MALDRSKETPPLNSTTATSWKDGKAVPTCPLSFPRRCNDSNPDLCCGGGADSPCSCTSCHPANDRLIACAQEMADMLLSMFVHVSHGGPTRAEAEALLKKAGVL